MEIGTISRQTPQPRQDQLIRAAKTSVIEVLIVSTGEIERESCKLIMPVGAGEGGAAAAAAALAVKQPQTIVLSRIH